MQKRGFGTQKQGIKRKKQAYPTGTYGLIARDSAGYAYFVIGYLKIGISYTPYPYIKKFTKEGYFIVRKT